MFDLDPVPDPSEVREYALHTTRLCVLGGDLTADELIERAQIVASWLGEARTVSDFERRRQAIRHARGGRLLEVADLLADAMKLYAHMTGAESWEMP